MIRFHKRFLGVLFLGAFLLAGCSQPVLEPPECLAARDSLRRLYSMHMDGGPNPKNAKLEKMKSLVSKDLYERLSSAKPDGTDILTQSDNFPKAFRAGECRVIERGPEFDILLFWRNEGTSVEKKIRVAAIDEDGWVVADAKTAQ